MSARKARASVCEISFCAASAAQVRRKAPPTMATPNAIAANWGSSSTSPSLRTMAGMPTRAAIAIQSQFFNLTLRLLPR